MRKALLIFYIFITPISLSQSKSSILENINQLKWGSRIILVRSTNNLEETLSVLKMANRGIRERHIHWFVFSQSNIYTNYESNITNSFKKHTVEKYFSTDELDVVIIGKDGYVKRRAKNLNLNSIFELIDLMPMRKMEMKNNYDTLSDQ